jgi:hypothetical protein
MYTNGGFVNQSIMKMASMLPQPGSYLLALKTDLYMAASSAVLWSPPTVRDAVW